MAACAERYSGRTFWTTAPYPSNCMAYVINEDQAETVRMIFDLYLEGLGETKICKELCRRQRKDGHGNVSWSVSKISRILRNATYMGYKCYLKSYSNNYLEQKRIKNLDESTYLYVKGDFEPIIPEEVFKRCEEIRKTRTTKMIINKGERTYGKRASQDVWLRKLRCSCGSTFRKKQVAHQSARRYGLRLSVLQPSQ